MSNTILLVDDEPNILRALTRMFSEDNYEIFTANSGEEGLELLKKHEIQVVISDQRMPNMLGSDFLSRVNHLYPETVRIILSAYSDFSAIRDAINEGAIYKFVNKPWNERMLRQLVLEAFETYRVKRQSCENLQLDHFDRLTNLQNRFCFNETLQSSISEAKSGENKFAVVYLDIDRFTKINETFGLENGDKLLQIIAEKLESFIGNKSKIARLGNDEFAIIITEQSYLLNLGLHLENIRNIIQDPVEISDTTLYMSASIGASVYPDDGDNPDLLMKSSRSALRHAQHLGGNNFQIFQENMITSTKDQLILEMDLHRAIENNEFVIYYQPIVNINDNKVTSVEALIRWQHPKFGLIPPLRFLSLCEDTGLIVPIGNWVIRTVCEQIKEWREHNLTDVCVAINLSTRQFNDKTLLPFVINILQITDIPPSCLEFEITESLIMQNIESSIALLKSFRSLGINLALDDFGTGYSSLSYLRNFPFNILKIDKSFIDDVTQGTGSAGIVDAIISMGKTLGMTLIAEGVEQKQQLEFLQAHNCDLMQGYFYSKPIPVEEFTRLLEKASS